MPTRRTLLGTLGVPLLTATGGCLERIPGIEDATLSYKAISVRWHDEDGRGHDAELCWLWSDGRSRVYGWEPTAYPEIVRSPTAVRISEETERQLERRFDGVAYVVGFSDPDAVERSPLENDRGQVGVPRRTFNRLQFGDRATIHRRGSGLRILAIQDGPGEPPDDWQIDVRARDLHEQFPDRNIPEQ